MASTRDRRARAGVAGAYFVQGLCFAGLLTQVPVLQEKFGLMLGACVVEFFEFVRRHDGRRSRLRLSLQRKKL